MAGRVGSRAGARRLWAAVLAVLALMTQAMIPAAAARAQAAAPSLIICTAQGAKAAATHGGLAHKDGFAGLPCARCLALSLAAVAPQAPSAPTRVAYAGRSVGWAPAVRPGLPGARAPPRPPSQAPPVVLNV